MKGVPYCLALLALTVLWAGPARAAHRTLGEGAELLGAEIVSVDAVWTARGAATLHSGELYLSADEITVTLDAMQRMVDARAQGRARLSFGSMHAVANGAAVDAKARTVWLSGEVTVYRDGAEIRGADALVELDDASVRVRPAVGRIELPVRVKE